jgi:phage gpG-like protein
LSIVYRVWENEAVSETTLKIDGLENLAKMLKRKSAVVKIGVLAGAGQRSQNDGVTNAEIGAAHEYGTKKMPMRSFLRVPLADHLNKKLQNEKLLSNDVLRDCVKEKSLKPWLNIIGTTAHQIVLEAFASNGYGKWEKYKDPNYQNNTGMKLVDTTQLRDSITWIIKE